MRCWLALHVFRLNSSSPNQIEVVFNLLTCSIANQGQKTTRQNLALQEKLSPRPQHVQNQPRNSQAQKRPTAWASSVRGLVRIPRIIYCQAQPANPLKCQASDMFGSKQQGNLAKQKFKFPRQQSDLPFGRLEI